MNIEISFPGGDAVEARYAGLTVRTDQDGTAPAPFDLFLASIATCTGTYVARFCRQREIDPTSLRLRQTSDKDPATGMVSRIDVHVLLPDDFPARYRSAVIRAAELCTVKKHLQQPPEITVTADTAPASRCAG